MVNKSSIIAEPCPIDRDGFTIVPDVLDAEVIALLLEHLECVPLDRSVSHKRGSAYGIRNLLDLVPLTREIANSPAPLTWYES